LTDRHVLDFIRSSLPDPPARVLEIGAGGGELAEVLRADGYDVLAIDPSSTTPAVERLALLDVAEPPGSFDAAVAVVSLHHVHPLAESCAHLAELVRPGGVLVVHEFDTERLEERDAESCSAHDSAHQHPAEAVAALHPVTSIREHLGAYFTLTAVSRDATGPRFTGTRKS
jgi:2-polyprenyl-3-methyl-5-hydroxy-6-metoxy-1,4-benzoquinol methylase